MSTDPNNPNQRESDEAEFEASLVSDTEADLDIDKDGKNRVI
jgi:hypothetical protein